MFRSPEDPERILTAEIQRWVAEEQHALCDALAVEEPLELFLGSAPLAVIMRTPGHDDELATGFLHGEGILSRPEQLRALRVWQDEHGALAQNRVTIDLDDSCRLPNGAERRFYATSSCGMCGKASIETALQVAPPLPKRLPIDPRSLYGLPAQLEAAQRVFAHTGGLHAAALYDLDGHLTLVREDVGRHNAVDKLVGRSFLDGSLPLHERLLLVSGRVSFEILQKALAARIPAIAAVSAPSSLAVSLARRSNIALFGFLRGDRVNVYA